MIDVVEIEGGRGSRRGGVDGNIGRGGGAQGVGGVDLRGTVVDDQFRTRGPGPCRRAECHEAGSGLGDGAAGATIGKSAEAELGVRAHIEG